MGHTTGKNIVFEPTITYPVIMYIIYYVNVCSKTTLSTVGHTCIRFIPLARLRCYPPSDKHVYAIACKGNLREIMTECYAKGILYFQIHPLCVVHIHQVV